MKGQFTLIVYYCYSVSRQFHCHKRTVYCHGWTVYSHSVFLLWTDSFIVINGQCYCHIWTVPLLWTDSFTVTNGQCCSHGDGLLSDTDSVIFTCGQFYCHVWTVYWWALFWYGSGFLLANNEIQPLVDSLLPWNCMLKNNFLYAQQVGLADLQTFELNFTI